MTLSPHKEIPIITIDGPSGAGKGTLACHLAEVLMWHFLDSGAIYRLLALKIARIGVLARDIEQAQDLSLQIKIAKNLNIAFKNQRCYLDNDDVTEAIREENVGLYASKISALPEIREALLERQRAFAQLPGLVADGRDMGSVVFPQATLKLYLEADPRERARRRELQLKARGIAVIFDQLLCDIEKRDHQDKTRLVSPLVVPEGAVVIDSTNLNQDEVFAKVMLEVRRCFNVGGN